MKIDNTKIYHDLLNRYITIFSGSEELGPEEVNIIRFNLRGLFIAYFIVAKELPSEHLTISGIKEWVRSTMGADNIFLSIIDNCPRQIIDDLLKVSPEAPLDDLGYTYEKLLSIDANSIQASYDDRNRNETGSYFTPVDLADFTIEKVLYHYISENSLDSLYNARVADFACGSGVFLTEYLRLAASHGIEKQLLVDKIYGFDVDPIVLEIAKYNVLLELGDLNKYDTISRHFIHCNFLLNNQPGMDARRKIEAAKKGYIYDNALSVDITSLSNFEIILGNPPWEKIRFEERSIRDLYCEPSGTKLEDYIRKYQSDIESAKKDIKKSANYSGANSGELNTYALFTKAAVNLLAPKGSLGLIVKSSLVTSQVYSKFFKEIRQNVFSVYDFVNSKKIFDIDGRERFSVICISRTNNTESRIGMNISSVEDADKMSAMVNLSECDIINPVTGTLPNVKSVAEIEMLVSVHRSAKYFYKEYSVKYGRLVHLTNHKDYIIKSAELGYLPIYEGKFIAQYDANYSGFNHVPENKKYTSKATSAPLSREEVAHGVHPESRYFISKDKWDEISHNYKASYMLAWHSLTSATNNITCVATILPFIPTCQSIQFLITEDDRNLIYLTGLFNSSIFEYIIKKKLSGIDLTKTIIDQMPVPSKDNSSEIVINGTQYYAKEVVINAVAYLLREDNRLSELITKNINTELYSQIHSREDALAFVDEAIAIQYNILNEELQDIKKALAN